jgi:hypothetical protein
VKVCPAIVAVPVRCVVCGLLATVSVTFPFPDPDAPLVTVIQSAFRWQYPRETTEVLEHAVLDDKNE